MLFSVNGLYLPLWRISMTTRVSVLQYTLGIAQTRWTDIIINIVIENNLIAIDATCSLKALEKISKLDGYVS